MTSTSTLDASVTTDHAVLAEGLSKKFGDRVAVDDVSFRLSPGRITGLLGRNGAGKTTVIRMILGLTPCDEGRVEVLGTDRATDHADSIGIAMDALGFFPGATVRRELDIWAGPLGVAGERVHDIIDLVGLNGHERTPAHRLSTGQKQRLRLGTALLPPNLRLVVLDEPTNGLDPDGIRWLRRTARGLADRGVCVLLCSHMLTEVENIVDDVLLMERGRLVVDSSLHDFTRGGTERLEDRYFALVGEKGNLA